LLGLVAGRIRQFTGAFLTRGSNLEPGQRYAIEKAVGYAVVVFGTIIGLQSAGINLSSLAVVGGALGIGIGLGFQEATNNFLSGIILLVERPIKVGDRVEVGNLNGDVVRIGSRATWIRTNANIAVIVPNSEFVMRQVINWTATDRQVRFDLPVGVTYKADPEEVRDALLGIAIENPDVLEHPEPDVLFKGFGDSSLDFELRVWTKSQVRTPNVLRSDLYFAIFRELARRGIEIPYPQRDLHLRSSEARIQIDPAS
jgi:small-conductance mechanosensitive channel